MSDKRKSGSLRGAEGHRSDFARIQNVAETLDFSAFPLGQRNPGDYPQHYPPSKPALSPLGEPIDIEEVAELLGCSVWTVRQRYLPGGLPHLRASTRGRFIFFRKQVIDWILERQKKEGR
jgi:hypothetical protein